MPCFVSLFIDSNLWPLSCKQTNRLIALPIHHLPHSFIILRNTFIEWAAHDRLPLTVLNSSIIPAKMNEMEPTRIIANLNENAWADGVNFAVHIWTSTKILFFNVISKCSFSEIIVYSTRRNVILNSLIEWTYHKLMVALWRSPTINIFFREFFSDPYQLHVYRNISISLISPHNLTLRGMRLN